VGAGKKKLAPATAATAAALGTGFNMFKNIVGAGPWGVGGGATPESEQRGGEGRGM